jgi:signal transduction histidine kinase
VEMKLQEGLPLCRVDPDMIQQVLLNLFLNGIQAQPGGGRIVLMTSCQEPGNGPLLITLQDAGPGIPAEVRKKIFDPFFTTKHTGTGLGLAICDQILEEHQGRLEIESEPGQGTTCRIYLPVAE